MGAEQSLRVVDWVDTLIVHVFGTCQLTAKVAVLQLIARIAAGAAAGPFLKLFAQVRADSVFGEEHRVVDIEHHLYFIADFNVQKLHAQVVVLREEVI